MMTNTLRGRQTLPLNVLDNPNLGDERMYDDTVVDCTKCSGTAVGTKETIEEWKKDHICGSDDSILTRACDVEYQFVLCLDCNGTGKKHRGKFLSFGGYRSFPIVSCPSCKGTGRG